MNTQERFVLFMVLLALAANGWGLATVGLLTRSHRLADNEVRLEPAMNIAVGAALFAVVGGLFVAAGIAYYPLLLGWQIVGCVLTFSDVIVDRAQRIRERVVKLRTLPAISASLFLVFMALGPALSGAWNPNDDAPAYSYLGQRLLSTGGLVDPFNTRRLNSYGAAELFQALVIKMVNELAGIGIEWFFFLLLTVALFVRSIDRRFAFIALLTVGLGIEVMHPVGAWANLAPTFSGTALTLALARLLSEHRGPKNATWVYVAGGLLFAGLLALRIEFILPAFLLLVTGAFFRRRTRLAVGLLATSGAVVVLSLVGWAVALERSSGTPIFPLFASYWTQASWFVNPAIHTFGQYLSNFVKIAQIDHWDIGLIGAFALAIVGRRLTKWATRRDPAAAALIDTNFRMETIWTLTIGCGVLLVYETYSLPGGAPGDVMRYAAPSLLVLVLFTLDRLWATALDLWHPTNSKERVASSRNCALVLGFGGLALFGLFLGDHPTIYQNYFSKNMRQAVAATTGEPVLADIWNARFVRSQTRYYAKINDHIPKGTYLLAAVELPGLLDMGKFSFTTLDEPGGTSPPPHIAYNQDAQQLVSYLRHQGIDGIVANTAGAYGLYNLSISQQQLRSPVPTYRVTAQFIVKWDRLLLEVEHRYLTVRIGPLRYIAFNRPR